MSYDKERVLPSGRPLQGCLPFDDVAAGLAPSPAVRAVEPEAVHVEAELSALSDVALRERFESLRGSRDQRPQRVIEMFLAMGILAERGLLAGPLAARHAVPAAVPAVVKAKSPAACARQLRTILDRLARWPTAVQEEALVDWLEQELGPGRRQDLRRIVGSVRDGALPHGVVVVAHRRAKRPQIRHPAACFVRYIFDRKRCVFDAWRR